MRWLSEEPNPIGVTTLLAMCRACEPVFRSSYVPRQYEDMTQVLDLVADFGRADFVNNTPVVKNPGEYILLPSNWDTGLNVNMIERLPDKPNLRQARTSKEMDHDWQTAEF